MIKNILVPLDGSKLAESAFNPAVSLAQTLDAPITLLHIIEKDAPQEVHSEHHLTRVDEAVEYLNKLASNVMVKNLKVNTHVHSAEQKDVAASIIQHANEEFLPELIVMCAHGKSGIRDLVFGNIAQQVLAGGRTPLLLIQPVSPEPRPFSLHRIFVPLDSESKHDESLNFAMELAKACSAEVYLFTVIPTFTTLSGREAAVSSMLPATASAYLEMLEQTAKEHLQIHLDEFLKAGINTNAEIGRGDPADLIVTTAIRENADLILLSTHRKAGMVAFWARSVAPNVLKKTRIPLMLVPLKE
jgi:nucleotide-binding universal stress UspA family protein